MFLGLAGVEGGAGGASPWAGFRLRVESFGADAEAVEGFEAGWDAMVFEAYPP